MNQAFGYDMYCTNNYIDTSDLTPDLIHPDMLLQTSEVQNKQAQVQPTKSEPFYGSNNNFMYMSLHKKIAEQRFQIFCMWLLLAVCVIVMMNMRSKESQLANIMYMLHMNSQKSQLPTL